MAGHVKDITAGHDVDVDSLFEKYTVDEIRDIEKRTRQSIEKKKEDLRQMVGERYRDLIEAADTITEMKKSADNVTQSISRIQDLCTSLKQSLVTTPKADFYYSSKDSKRKSQQKMLFSTAVNLKLLMDMPERIWSALDLRHYLLATRLYLLARHIYNTVQLDPEAAVIVGHCPLLARQWASVCHFKMIILQYCHACLRDTAASDQIVSECLGSIFLLEDHSMEQVFNQFLCARADAVQQLFQADSSDTSVRSQICDVMCLIVNTAYQIYSIFYVDDNKLSTESGDKQVTCNLLVTLLKMATSKNDAGAILSKDAASPLSGQYISKIVSDFRPSPRHQLVPVSLHVLTTSSQQFLQRCVTNVQGGLASILNYVTTVKGLAAIRDELWNLLQHDERLPLWDTICSQIFGRRVHVWSEFASQIFITRIEELLQSQFDAAGSAGCMQVGRVLSDLCNYDDRSVQWERDLSSYVWTDSIYEASSSSSASKLIGDSGALIMKARGYTPAVQSLCRGLDQRLKALLEDAVCYIQVAGNQPDTGPFNRLEDKARIQKFVQTACEDCIIKQLKYLREQLDSSKQQLVNDNGKAPNQVTIYRLLLMARYTNALCELSPNLHLCMSCEVGDEVVLSAITRSASKKALLSRTSPKSTGNPCWISLRDQLISFSHDAFGAWVDYASDKLIAQFKSTLCSEASQNILMQSTQWDCIEIEEETEDNKKVKSTIRVPMQASWYAQTMLYNVCEDINHMGGQTLHSSSLNSLVRRLIDGILESYEHLLKSSQTNSLSQNRSLQLLFDLKFLMNILGHKENYEAGDASFKRLQVVVDRLETNVDPFDLDVFSPHMQNHLTRHTQRSSVLFGLLVPVERRLLGNAAYSSLPAIGTQQDQHNVLPLATCQNRFPLLPLSVQTSAASSIQPIIQPPKSKMVLPTTVNPVTAAAVHSVEIIQPSRTSSSSFLEQMSTMWFSGGK